jgi:tetratricopeptide (TPR) repeat protein
VKLLESVADRVENKGDLWFNMGVMKEDLGDKQGAEQCYRKALEAKPDDLDSNHNLALLLMARGDWKGATPYLEKVAGLTPDGLDAKVNLAAAYYNNGRKEDAVELWKEVVRRAPARTDVRLNLAGGLWEMKDYDGAYFHYKTALGQRPNDAVALNGVGLWQMAHGQNATAEKSFRSSVAADPKFAAAYNNLAVSLERQNRRKEAITVLEKGLKSAGHDPDIERNLQRLRSAEKN